LSCTINRINSPKENFRISPKENEVRNRINSHQEFLTLKETKVNMFSMSFCPPEELDAGN